MVFNATNSPPPLPVVTVFSKEVHGGSVSRSCMDKWIRCHGPSFHLQLLSLFQELSPVIFRDFMLLQGKPTQLIFDDISIRILRKILLRSCP